MEEFVYYKSMMFSVEVTHKAVIVLSNTIIIALLIAAIFNYYSNINILIVYFFTIFLFGVSLQKLFPIIRDKIKREITQKVIENYCNNKGLLYLYDILVSNSQTGYSQIDHVIITKKGIAVIKTNFHEGDIYGLEYSAHWKYFNGKNRIQKRQNPVRQNYNHIEALKKLLNMDLVYYNIVSFLDSAIIENCKFENRFTKVIYTYELKEILEKMDELCQISIPNDSRMEIYKMLKDSNIVDKKVRKEYIKNLKAEMV